MLEQTERLRNAVTEARQVREAAIHAGQRDQYEPLFTKLMAAVDKFHEHRHNEIKRLGLEVM